MADEDLTILDENKPNGDTEEVAVLDDYQRETRKKLKAFIGIEHDPVTGAHVVPHGVSDPGGTPREGAIWYHETQRELIIANGGYWRSVQTPTFNYALNGMFDLWSGLPSRFPGWWVSGNGAPIINRQSTNNAYGLHNARIRATTDYVTLYQNIANSVNNDSPFSPYTYWKGKIVTLGALVRCSTATCAYLQMYDGINYYIGPNIYGGAGYHPGDGTWRWMTLTHFLDWGLTNFQIYIVGGVVGANVDIAGVTLVEGHSCPHPIPSGWQGRSSVVHFGSQDIRPIDNTNWWYGSRGHVGVGGPWNIADVTPYDCNIRNLVVNTQAQVGAGTFSLQVDVNNTLPGMGITMTGAVNVGTNYTQGIIMSKNTWLSIATSQNGGNPGALFGSYTLDEVPNTQ